MPLIHGKSKKSLEKNIKTEMEAHPGKEHRAQDLAIAFSVQRKAKAKKYAKGGMIPEEYDARKESLESESIDHEEGALGRYSKGGMVDMEPKDHGDELMERDDESRLMKSFPPESDKARPEKWRDEKDADKHDLGGAYEEHYDSIADAILGKARKAKMMAEGGMIDDDMSDIDENEEEPLMPQDGARFTKRYGEDIGESKDQPMDSNEHGDDIDSDEHDHIEMMRRKLMAKRGR